ncbi:MAG: type I glyceraldehyde-3-phosphate dehydrogenase [Candidatus Peregrinibacteria bacterium]
MKRIAINGFGRIGRMVTRALFDHHAGKFELVAINDLTDPATLAHLFEFDSTYGHADQTVSVEGNIITINGSPVQVFSEKDPSALPWKSLDIDVVLECTGFFVDRAGMEKHRTAGAKKVILSAPAKDEIDLTVVLGVNDEEYDPQTHHLISNASCTTNCLAPVVKVLQDSFGIKRGLMTTIHSYTGDQRLLDAPHSDLRRARSAAESMIPTKTGAAKAIGLVIPALAGKLHGMAIRIPTPTVSVVDLTVELEKNVTKEELNTALQNAAKGALAGILGVELRPLVSKDFQKDARSSIVDALSTTVIDGNFAKLLSWYDNEWGYSCRLADLSIRV